MRTPFIAVLAAILLSVSFRAEDAPANPFPELNADAATGKNLIPGVGWSAGREHPPPPQDGLQQQR